LPKVQSIEINNPMNAILNLLCNIAIPIFILNKMSLKWGPVATLVVALVFPLGFGLFEYFYHHKKSMISVLGIINVLIGGGFTLLKLEGHWFAVKEAAFPVLIGIFVFLSPYFSRPFIENLFLNPEVMNSEVIQKTVIEKGLEQPLKRLLRQSNNWFSASFGLSGIINYWLAIKIFSPMDPNLTEAAKGQLLNEQLAEMNSKGLIFIAVPSLVISMALLFYFLNRLEILTGIKKENLMKS
jgi:hypothetical protein